MSTDPTYEEFVQSLDLSGISLVECSAKRQGSAEIDRGLDTVLSIETAHRIDDREIDYRFRFVCEVTQDEAAVAEMIATYVASFASEGDHGGQPNVVAQFAQDVAVMAAYPYVREFVQTMAARLDLPGFTLGLAKRGELVIHRPASGHATAELES